MSKTRLKPEARKEDVLAVALTLAAKVGYPNTTRAMLADACGLSGAALNYHFGTMAQLRRAVVRAAVKAENLEVIAQAILSGDEKLVTDAALRRRALDSIS